MTESIGKISNFRYSSILIFLFLLVAIYSEAFSDIIRVRFVLIIIGIAILIFETDFSTTNSAVVMATIIFPLYSIILIQISTSSVFNYDPDYAMNIQRLFILGPLYLRIGYLLYRNTSIHLLNRLYLLMCLPTAVVSIFEYKLHTSFCGQAFEILKFSREGTVSSIRGLACTQQPLVLGTFLLCAIPIVTTLRNYAQLPVLMLLLGGIYASGSRGPTYLGILFACFLWIPILRKYGNLFVKGLILFITPTIFILSFFFFSPIAAGATGESFSSGYRQAVYSFMPKLLSESFFGNGLGPIPYGMWLIDSERGVRDLSVTVDSEIVYSVISLGILGIALQLIILFVTYKSFDIKDISSTQAFFIFIMGLVLAIHAWDTLGSFWYLVVGASAGRIRSKNAEQELVRQASLSQGNLANATKPTLTPSGRVWLALRAG